MSAKGTIFYKKSTLNIKGKPLHLERPLIQGILNITPDSFHDGGMYTTLDQIQLRVQKMVKAGADIIDIGGQSSRPGAKLVEPEEEFQRIEAAIKWISNEYPDVLVSVDTFYSEVAKKAVECGASLINDISGGELDPNMFETVGQLGVPYVLMHMRGTPNTMTDKTDYKDLVKEMCDYFEQKIEKLRSYGTQDIIIDPGFGFAKTLDQNYYLLKHLEVFELFETPILVGVSRKSMIYKLLNIRSEDALVGTAVLNTFAMQKGASIIRVHDVKEAVQTLQIVEKLRNVSV